MMDNHSCILEFPKAVFCFFVSRGKLVRFITMTPTLPHSNRIEIMSKQYNCTTFRIYNIPNNSINIYLRCLQFILCLFKLKTTENCVIVTKKKNIGYDQNLSSCLKTTTLLDRIDWIITLTYFALIGLPG